MGQQDVLVVPPIILSELLPRSRAYAVVYVLVDGYSGTVQYHYQGSLWLSIHALVCLNQLKIRLDIQMRIATRHDGGMRIRLVSLVVLILIGDLIIDRTLDSGHVLLLRRLLLLNLL